jgi:ssRNA-specific RNase YbeY (16S rRNA maturation enzyme)
LQAIKDAAKQEILREAFDKEPVIDGPELELNNQNWENDIDNSSQEEEINFIKERVLADIRNKRANKDKATKIISLLAQAKQEKN